VEGDASSASYFLAGATITGGTITVEGCGSDSLQGDKRFAEVGRGEQGGRGRGERGAWGLAVVWGVLGVWGQCMGLCRLHQCRPLVASVASLAACQRPH
jgi:hypothetical protein